MTLHERYLLGETEQVYNDVLALGQSAFEPENYLQIDKVLTETFQRVAHNLQVLYEELQKINYQFKTSFQHNFEQPLHAPLSNTNDLLVVLNETVKPFGYVPLSLQYFYKIVGAVNFAWDYEANEDLMWNMADPIQIASIDAVVNEVKNKYWQEEMQENVEDDDVASLQLAADVFHKDNISGGPAYALEITQNPSIDGLFLNEPHNTTFINYLRICFNHCGFPGLKPSYDQNGYSVFFDRVKPKLKKI